MLRVAKPSENVNAEKHVVWANKIDSIVLPVYGYKMRMFEVMMATMHMMITMILFEILGIMRHGQFAGMPVEDENDNMPEPIELSDEDMPDLDECSDEDMPDLIEHLKDE